jgi:hypothetical protein
MEDPSASCARIRARSRYLTLKHNSIWRYHLAMPMDMNALARLGARTRIAELTAEIESLFEAFPGLGARAEPAESESSGSRQRRTMSAATKATIKAAWARRRRGTEAGFAQAAPEPLTAVERRRTISAAGKARIAAAQKKRWAAVRKAKKKR